jgi:hypothetical protein
LDENHLLFQQNNERNLRKATKARVQGTARVMTYEDLIAPFTKPPRAAIDREVSS